MENLFLKSAAERLFEITQKYVPINERESSGKRLLVAYREFLEEFESDCFDNFESGG